MAAREEGKPELESFDAWANREIEEEEPAQDAGGGGEEQEQEENILKNSALPPLEKDGLGARLSLSTPSFNFSNLALGRLHFQPVCRVFLMKTNNFSIFPDVDLV